MDLKVVAVLFLLSAFAISSNEGKTGYDFCVHIYIYIFFLSFVFVWQQREMLGINNWNK